MSTSNLGVVTADVVNSQLRYVANQHTFQTWNRDMGAVSLSNALENHACNVMVLGNDGNLGIGVTMPLARIHTSGEIRSDTLVAERALVANADKEILASSVTTTELEYLSGVTSAIQTQLNGKESSITGAASSITSTNLTSSRVLESDGFGKVTASTITTTELAYLTGLSSTVQSQLNAKQVTITGAATSVVTNNLNTSIALVSDGNGKITSSSVTSTELDHLSGVQSAIQTQIDSKQATITGAATSVTANNLNASVAVISDSSGKLTSSSVTSTELNYLSGVQSGIQTQLDGKQASIVGAAASVVADNLSASIVVVSNNMGKIASSSVTSTELGHLSGTSSAIQTQLNAKQATITGAASSVVTTNLNASVAVVADSDGKLASSTVTASELGYLSGTSSAVQTQLNDKLSLSGGTVLGSVNVHGTLTASNVTIFGEDSSYFTSLSNMTGVLDVGKGGIGTTTIAANKLLVGNDTDAINAPTNLHWDGVNNRLGIGSVVPSTTLDVNGTIQAVAFIGDGSQLTGITGGSGGGGGVWSLCNVTAYIPTGSNVGIGTTDALATIHVYHSGAGDMMRIDDDNAPNTPPLIITSDGNVGIGTSTVSQKLQVQGDLGVSGQIVSTTTSSAPFHVQSSTLVSSLNADLLDGQEGTYYNALSNATGVLDVGKGGIGTTMLSAGKILVGNDTNSIITPSTLHWDDTNSRLGIGTDSPTTLLDVGGVARFASRVGIGGDPHGTIALNVTGDVLASGTITASNLTILGDTVVLNTTTSNTENMVITNAGTGPALKVTQSGGSAVHTVAEFYDAENSTPALYIANGGSVGIGTSSPLSLLNLWSASTPIIRMSGSSAALTMDDTTYIRLGATSTYKTHIIISGDAYPTGALAGRIVNKYSNHVSFTYTDGATETEMARLISSGNLGIGVADPASPLHVVGNIRSDNLTAGKALISDANKNVSSSFVSSTELGYVSGVTSAIQTQLNAKQATITGGATTIATTNLTVSRALVSDGTGKVATATTTSTELGYVNGVTSAIQTQLNAKQATITGAATSVVTNNLSASVAVVSDASGKLSSSSVTSTELGYVSGVTSDIQTQINSKQATIVGGASTITSANLTGSRALSSDATGKVVVATTTSTELGYVSGVTSAIQTQLNAKQATINGGASTIASTNLTISRALVSDTSGKVAVSTTTTTELGYVGGVTSAIQTQLDGKQATITGGASSIATADLTINRALVSDASGKVAVATATTSTELGYLSGVTSAIQTQIGSKQATITGGATTITSTNLTASRALISDASGKVAVAAVTSTELGYIDGVTSAIQTQLDGKLGLTSGGTVSGSTIFTSTLTTSNITAYGTITPTDVEVSVSSGPMIEKVVNSTTSRYGLAYATNTIRLFTGQVANNTINLSLATGATSYQDQVRVDQTGNLIVRNDITGFAATTLSDIRLKKDVKTLEDALPIIQALRPVSYRWNDATCSVEKRGSYDVGFIAQEVETLLPHIVKTVDDFDSVHSYKTITYDRVIPYLTKALQEFVERVQTLEQEVSDLKLLLKK